MEINQRNEKYSRILDLIEQSITPDYSNDFEPTDSQGYDLEGKVTYMNIKFPVSVSVGEKSYERQIAEQVLDQINDLYHYQTSIICDKDNHSIVYKAIVNDYSFMRNPNVVETNGVEFIENADGGNTIILNKLHHSKDDVAKYLFEKDILNPDWDIKDNVLIESIGDNSSHNRQRPLPKRDKSSVRKDTADGIEQDLNNRQYQ